MSNQLVPKYHLLCAIICNLWKAYRKKECATLFIALADKIWFHKKLLNLTSVSYELCQQLPAAPDWLQISRMAPPCVALSTTMFIQNMGLTSEDQKETIPFTTYVHIQDDKDHLLTVQPGPPSRSKIHPHTCDSLGRRSKCREQGAIMTKRLKHQHSEMKTIVQTQWKLLNLPMMA